MRLRNLKYLQATLLIFLLLLGGIANAADVITNGTFDSDITTGWTNGSSGSGEASWDNTIFGVSSGSLAGVSDTNRNRQFEMVLSQSVGTINAADDVALSLYWYKYSGSSQAASNTMIVRIIRPAGDSVDIFTESSIPGADASSFGNVTDVPVGIHFNQTGSYTIRLVGVLATPNDKFSFARCNFDDIILDVTGTANNAPTLTAGATSVSPATVNRFGTNTTTISTTFNDSDQPGVGAFTATFKVREPDNSTEVTLVNALTNGNGGLTISDGGGGSYTASYTWDPGAGQTVGDYDLYFDVSDGTDNTTDLYDDNLNELTVEEVLANNAPTLTAGATQVSPVTVNRVGANTTTISTTFNDSDQPGVSAFTATFKVREPDNSTEVTLVNAQTNGNGGLTITDGGGGSYTASYTWDPGAGQTLGDYDLYFEVSDGTDNVIDLYDDNLNELTVEEVLANNAPTLSAGVTSVSPVTVNKVGANTTTISTTFNDSDQPGVSAFTATFKVREPNNVTEVTLVNAQTNGNGGLTITDGGGGSYTATYTWDPGSGQTVGDYDLYFEVSDGTDNVIDDYADNNNELNVYQQTSPTVVAGATTVSPVTVNRAGTNSTTISTDFTDLDQPPLTNLWVTFGVREPNDITELLLVDALTNGNGGLTVTDNGGGSYTATYTWDPGPSQTLGVYDLYFDITDGSTVAYDNYADNLDELNIFEQNDPIVSTGATAVTVSPVARSGSNTTTLYAQFSDADIPVIGSFTVTFKVRRPDNSTEDILANALAHGAGVTIIDLGSGNYRAEYVWDPANNQQLGLYDLYFEVNDGTTSAIDGFANNLDELEVVQNPVGNAPTVVVGASQVSPSSINRIGANSTTISTAFTDADVPGVGAFTITFKVREPDNSTEVILVNALTDGVGGLSISDDGGGNYTASYTWDPGDAQTIGTYDLYFEVSDGGASAIDSYTDNLDELTITSQATPTVVVGATQVSSSPVNRIGTGTTTISTTFTDIDEPAVGSFTITFTVREPDNSTEGILVNALAHGAGGLSVIDNGGGSYTASFTWDPGSSQTLGLYDLFFEVDDGTTTATDNYSGNIDELEIIAQNAPTVVAGATSVAPSSVNRIGANSTTISTSFTDIDQPGVSAFIVSFKVHEPDNSTEGILVNAQTNGNGGLTITDDGGGNYTASYSWDPGDAQTIGLYDLYFEVSDGVDNVIDGYTDNLDELTIISQTDPTVVAGATQVSSSPVNRIGAGTTTISTTFSDIDEPAVASFTISFKVREPNNSTELTLVNALSHGTGGLTVIANGSGSYTASYTWNPDDAQTIGLYDLYFNVNDGSTNATDDYPDNLDELEIISQNAPTVVAGTTSVAPSSINRIGTNSTTISTSFTDIDQPGVSAFTVSFKVREPNNSSELTLVNAQTNGNGGLTITDDGGGNYTASYSWDPGNAQTVGLYDLYFEVSDGVDNVIDGYTDNLDELTVISQSAPTLSAAATAVSVSPVNRIGNVTTVISAIFTDVDGDAVSAFTCTFTIREPDNTTELILVNGQTHGAGGLTVIDNGDDTYTASYTYNPDDAQTIGLYDLSFDVTDVSGTASDTYGANLNELQINEVLANSVPTIASGEPSPTVSPVNRWGGNSTTISTDFNDTDIPGVGAFYITLKIREPNNITEIILLSTKQDGSTGLTIVDNGAGSYTANYIYNPDDAQTLGLYDIYIEVSDGIGSAIDDFTNNLDELEINEVLPNNPPQLTNGATDATPAQGNRWGSNTTTISAAFYDPDIPGVNAYTVSFKIREPDNSTELTLVNNQGNGAGGLSIIHLGGGTYRIEYTYNPDDAQTLGLYDLYCQVIDGSNTVTDDYANNLDELEIIDVPSNFVPNIVASATTVSPSSIDRVGGATTTFSAIFDDTDDPGIGGFFVTMYARAPFSQAIYTVADSLSNGQSGMTITAGSGSSYTATISWNPPDNAVLGYYDLMTVIYDAENSDTDLYVDNASELLISSGGENIPPVVPSDNVFATPAAIERVGANTVTLSATFSDGDAPAVSQFRVTFKVREPDGSTEIVLANNAANGAGVTIINDGGGIYTASTTWDPPDLQTLGFHDLYFHVTDQIATSYDSYSNNLGELEIIDAVASSSTPSLVAGNTSVSPTSINLVGSEFSTISSTFKDADMPGTGAFVVTIKVRDQSSTEYTLLNAVNDGVNGLNITHLADSTYQALLQFDPDVTYPTGTYDLYFYVQDNNGFNVTDGYINNADELTITSSTLLGDGNILRRTNDAATCMACHDIPDHQGQNCLVCHSPHNTTNIFLVKESIQTPSSGTKTVLFKTVGIGDAYNDPDPVEGDDAAGAMADDANSVQTEVCEVCHTSTKYYRNDDSHTLREHHNDEDCTACHPHNEGFPDPGAGGGESSGGVGCTCHSSIFNPMNSSTSSYHHQIDANAADYTLSAKTCLMCHVDHDIFRPDLNTGIGTRSKNLRADITSSVVQGNSSVLADYDYTSSGTGGICLSCHTSAQTKGYTQPDGTTETIVINKSDFDAATSSHNYIVNSTFNSDGSTFNATCIKCHNDSMTKSYQSSTYKFSEHDSDYRRILTAEGVASPADPLEEDFCFQCHSQTTNPNAGSNLDYYGTKGMTAASLKIEQVFGYTTAHPTGTFSGRHKPGENASDLADGNRHAECADCHDVHKVLQGTHDGTSNLVSNALKGTWGVEPTFVSTPTVPTTNANVFDLPTGYTRMDPAQKEYQICLKCHSNYTTLPSGGRNLAEELHPDYPSTHGIIQPTTNAYINANTMLEPWASSGITWCSDCHSSNVANDPKGPHGSNLDNLLVATIVSDGTNGTPLCYTCHISDVYWTDGCRNCPDNSKYPDHPASQGAHKLAPGCFSCHMWDHSSTAGSGEQTNDWPNGGFGGPGGAPDIKIWAHGQNKRWVYYTYGGIAAGTDQPVDNFINGYIANMDHSANMCWAETCKNHANKAY